MKNIVLKKNKFTLFVFTLMMYSISAQQIDPPNGNNTNIKRQSLTAQESYLVAKATGEYSVWLGCGHTKIQKPFIYVEGIDLFVGNNEHSNQPTLNNGEEFIRDLMVDGYDIIQLDFRQGSKQFIQRNAELLITLINNVNAQLVANGSKHGIVLMGESMGGVITHYALAKMEDDGIEHNVRLWLSLDGPQQGSTIPWGLQYFANSLVTSAYYGNIGPLLIAAFGGFNIITAYTQNYLSLNANLGGAEAPFQLLRDSPIFLANGFGFGFRYDMNSLNNGNYPTQSRNVGLSNGANNGAKLKSTDENYDDDGINPLVEDVNEGSTLLRLTLPTFNPLNWTEVAVYNSYAAPGPALYNVFLKVTTSVYNNEARFYLPTLPAWDVAPGGTQLFDADYLAYKFHRFSFIPLVSSLDLSTNNPYYSLINGVSGFNTSQIPNSATGFQTMHSTGYTHSNTISKFDVIWADGDNSKHVAFENQNELINGVQKMNMEDFLKSEISPSTLVLQDKAIDDGKIFEASQNIIIGKNESPAFKIGDVTFENGSEIEVRAGSEIHLRNGFQAESGSEVHLHIDSYSCF